jgi:TonB family protein
VLGIVGVKAMFRQRLAFIDEQGVRCKNPSMKSWLFVVVLASGLSAQTVDSSESKPRPKELAIGYVVCSDRSDQFASVFLNLCRNLPAGRISCGQTVNVVQRRGDWIEIALPDGLSRYLPASMVSRSAERFVPLDRDSGITDKGPVECPGGPAPGSPLSDVVGPHAIFAPDPSYPEAARQRAVSGEVTLALDVLPDGSTNNIRIVKSLDPALDQSAIETVASWKFKPATKAGIPLKTEIKVEISFRLSGMPQSGLVYTGLPCAAKIDARDIKGLLKKAYKGDPKAQFVIGCACEYGVARASPDPEQAIDWYRKAAQFFLGRAYLLKSDYVRAYTWLRIANLGGYKDPSNSLEMVTQLLNEKQLGEAEEQVTAWKGRHGTN